jgi:hypothetical protein
LGVGLLIGYVALRQIGPWAPIFAWMVEWLMPVALFLGLLAQRRRTSLFGRPGPEEGGDGGDRGDRSGRGEPGDRGDGSDWDRGDRADGGERGVDGDGDRFGAGT